MIMATKRDYDNDDDEEADKKMWGQQNGWKAGFAIFHQSKELQQLLLHIL